MYMCAHILQCAYVCTSVNAIVHGVITPGKSVQLYSRLMYVILMWSGAVPCGGGGGKGARRYFPPPPHDFFFLLFFLPFIILFYYLFIFTLIIIIFIFFACQLRAQSCTLMMIIPLTHYDNFATFFQVGGEMCHSPLPSPPPPFFFCLSAKRSVFIGWWW